MDWAAMSNKKPGCHLAMPQEVSRNTSFSGGMSMKYRFKYNTKQLFEMYLLSLKNIYPVFVLRVSANFEITVVHALIALSQWN